MGHSYWNNIKFGYFFSMPLPKLASDVELYDVIQDARSTALPEIPHTVIKILFDFQILHPNKLLDI